LCLRTNRSDANACGCILTEEPLVLFCGDAVDLVMPLLMLRPYAFAFALLA